MTVQLVDSLLVQADTVYGLDPELTMRAVLSDAAFNHGIPALTHLPPPPVYGRTRRVAS